MKYLIKENSIANFIAYAPLHKFKGRVEDGFSGFIDINLEKNDIKEIDIEVKTKFFTTGDKLKDIELHKYISSKKIEVATFKLKKLKSFKKVKDNIYQIDLLGILNFMNIERDLRLKFKIEYKDNLIYTKLNFDWSFKNYGFKAPQLLFLKVKDKVSINLELNFTQK